VYTGVMLIDSNEAMNIYHNLSGSLGSSRFRKMGRVDRYIFERTEKTEAVVILELYPKDGVLPEEWQFMFFEEMEYALQGYGGSVAIGRFYQKAEDIIKSYREAKESYAIGRVLWTDKQCFFYPMLSVYTALHCDSSKIDLSYIHMLEIKQAGFLFDGIETLESYIECGSYKSAALRLCIHENTLRYRIQKIGVALHLNMEDAVVRNALITQIKVWRMIKATGVRRLQGTVQ